MLPTVRKRHPAAIWLFNPSLCSPQAFFTSRARQNRINHPTRRTQSGRVSARLLLVGVRGSCSCTSICIRSRNRSLDPAKGHKAETASMLAPSLGGKQRYAVISLSPESFRASVALLHRAWSWLDTPTSARLILERRWIYAFFPSARRTDG
ncbi:hypothetical protein CTAM01_09176 [Colletotrichum tamarilloi]|uniref:Uncharacterized protein n=1 Tax=Colletotrichum tamarilloi TaxID=1209934 RepID=A0ABQ9R4F3_9PEZI|nr:uncharacterized protein CTAM01_09176 [Colletotrichum tamarilloi]KAI3540563.1 hypothetical protein CSPX01_08225 [Colletotrichum filicis]KAK1493985.1 hypothetical protein CTAM01_09176 [Colletotrichum tamarilloi]